MCDIFFSLRESAAKRFQGEFLYIVLFYITDIYKDSYTDRCSLAICMIHDGFSNWTAAYPKYHLECVLMLSFPWLLMIAWVFLKHFSKENSI